MSPADDAAGDFHKGFVNDCKTFETDAQAPEIVQPCDGALDDPAGFSEAAAVRGTAARNFGGNAGSMERLAVFVVVVSTIALDDDGFSQRATRLAPNRWNRFDQRYQLGDVVAIGACQDQRKRDALGFRDEMVF